MTALETPEETTSQKPLISSFTAGMVFTITGIIGSIASFLLLYERVLLWGNPDHITSCDVNPWVSCGQVMETWQASTFGFPNIFIGTTAFPILIIAGIVMLLAGKALANNKIWWAGLNAGALFSLGFITWLWYSAVFSIGVLCPYCMIVWAAVIPFSIFTFSYSISNRVFSKDKTQNKLAVFAQQWWWIIVILIYCGFIASIIIKFPHIF